MYADRTRRMCLIVTVAFRAQTKTHKVLPLAVVAIDMNIWIDITNSYELPRNH